MFESIKRWWANNRDQQEMPVVVGQAYTFRQPDPNPFRVRRHVAIVMDVKGGYVQYDLSGGLTSATLESFRRVYRRMTAEEVRGE